MKLGILRAEVLEAEDKVAEDEVAEVEVDVVKVDEVKEDVAKVILKKARIKLGNRTGEVVVNEEVEEVGLNQKWNVSSVTSTTTTQEIADR